MLAFVLYSTPALVQTMWACSFPAQWKYRPRRRSQEAMPRSRKQPRTLSRLPLAPLVSGPNVLRAVHDHSRTTHGALVQQYRRENAPSEPATGSSPSISHLVSLVNRLSPCLRGTSLWSGEAHIHGSCRRRTGGTGGGASDTTSV